MYSIDHVLNHLNGFNYNMKYKRMRFFPLNFRTFVSDIRGNSSWNDNPRFQNNDIKANPDRKGV